MKHEIIDIDEEILRDEYPEIFQILLYDHTTKQNIIWGNDNYKHLNPLEFTATKPIRSDSITGYYKGVIKPRALKTLDDQKNRTKENAEVFTPLHIIKKQNDAAEATFLDDDLETYVNRTWIEITCGEGPYIATRYDVTNGQLVPIGERQGFLDRKLFRISKEVDNESKWLELAIAAYKATYGFEWNGDSLLLARENLLFTFVDYFVDKFKKNPESQDILQIGIIISHNIFQMDGLTYSIPLSAQKIKVATGFDLFTGKETFEEVYSKGKKVYIMDWKQNKRLKFASIVNC